MAKKDDWGKLLVKLSLRVSIAGVVCLVMIGMDYFATTSHLLSEQGFVASATAILGGFSFWGIEQLVNFLGATFGF